MAGDLGGGAIKLYFEHVTWYNYFIVTLNGQSLLLVNGESQRARKEVRLNARHNVFRRACAEPFDSGFSLILSGRFLLI